ncbi:hypothetical protein [uncultured Corynebacterium sp.]|uniref:hypothetical protein n=1 Tax=uncultured Corynebacterium sp. TaxID=159447 RepID=UPI0025EDE35D|nr:hypothetical protein [uncultured Corynebacterium sp.]
MTLPEYRALGFTYDDFDDLVHDLHEEEVRVAEGYEAALVHQDPSGARITALQEEGEGWLVVPGFRTRHTVFAHSYRAAQHVSVVELIKDEKIYARLACASDDSFTLPASFPGGENVVRVNELQLSAAALDFTLDDVATGAPSIVRSESTERYYQSYSPRGLSPIADLDATLVGAERRTNEMGEESFWECGIELPGGILTLLLPGDTQPAAGQRFHGKVLMMANTGYWAAELAR